MAKKKEIVEKPEKKQEKKQLTLEERVERLEKKFKEMSYWTGIGL